MAIQGEDVVSILHIRLKNDMDTRGRRFYLISLWGGHSILKPQMSINLIPSHVSRDLPSLDYCQAHYCGA